jgi:hypothetical protein
MPAGPFCVPTILHAFQLDILQRCKIMIRPERRSAGGMYQLGEERSWWRKSVKRTRSSGNGERARRRTTAMHEERCQQRHTRIIH